MELYINYILINEKYIDLYAGWEWREDQPPPSNTQRFVYKLSHHIFPEQTITMPLHSVIDKFV